MHEKYMRHALDIAAMGGRSTLPNPLVGAVVVHNQEIIGCGYHTKFGAPHAEVEAIRSVEDKSLLPYSTLYVNLEPCSHFGKTPPCVDLILEHKIPHVVVGIRDPFIAVQGKGIERLMANGVKVEEGVLEQESRELNKRFITAHTLKRPYIILKWAETKDEFIAKKDGSSKWISSEKSRKLVHQWRGEEMAIMIGTNTASIDDPELTVRFTDGVNPIRIIIDKELKLPKSLKVMDQSVPTLIYNSKLSEKLSNLEFIKIDPSLKNILNDLYSKNIISLFVEGGASLLSSFIEAKLWDEARVFKSQKEFGEGIGAPKLPMKPENTKEYGEDLLLFYYRPILSAKLSNKDKLLN